jgi:hypothetical protein
MCINWLKRLALVGLIGLASGASEKTQAQDWYGQPGYYRSQYYGHLPGAETTYLYSPRHGWRQLPVVRGGNMPRQGGLGPWYDPGYSGGSTRPPYYGGLPYAQSETGYYDFWVPLSDVHRYQNDPRFRVVTPIPKEPPVAPPLPPRP